MQGNKWIREGRHRENLRDVRQGETMRQFTDKSGAIESDELRGLLKDLLDQAKKPYTADDLLELQQMIMRGCDVDHDGKINRRELTMILLALTKVHN
ncbi:unnamed protein product [Darwinula stevensoni]|uniref:EF-hand domain-containing protein n=1 Tax=Darwinula stevensoni TaxID=69355 RepID=A0A7R9A1X8_9CRUS|nr:unnamed protein product [Darwinula stevensoni]CAG0878710.1 unnamed protein product [Darwinula stevensoni]